MIRIQVQSHQEVQVHHPVQIHPVMSQEDINANKKIPSKKIAKDTANIASTTANAKINATNDLILQVVEWYSSIIQYYLTFS